MGEEHPNATAYRKTADAFRARDFDAIRSLVADDVVWHVPGRHPMAGEIRGLDALVAWLSRLSELGFTLRDRYGREDRVGRRGPRGRGERRGASMTDRPQLTIHLVGPFADLRDRTT